jgi:hypothetical protein
MILETKATYMRGTGTTAVHKQTVGFVGADLEGDEAGPSGVQWR